jgi:hypothetical protein
MATKQHPKSFFIRLNSYYSSQSSKIEELMGSKPVYAGRPVVVLQIIPQSDTSAFYEIIFAEHYNEKDQSEGSL